MRVLVLCADAGKRPSLAARLSEAGCLHVEQVADLAGADAALADADVLAVELGRPEPELLEALGKLSWTRDRPAAVFVDETDLESTRVALEAGISSYVVRGAEPGRLRDALEVARARFLVERALRNELAAARASLTDRKVVERAKGRLMKREGIDEQAAYDLLRRLAMRRHAKLIDVANAVLREGGEG